MATGSREVPPLPQSPSKEINEQLEAKSFLIRNIPNAVTCVTVGCGFLLMVSTSIPGLSPDICVFATLCGLVADVLDGTLARKLQVKSKFGATFDQLADLTCFGIGPAIFFTRQQQLNRSEKGTFYILLSLAAGYAYMACSTFRIARELIVHKGVRPLYFVGIPTNLACVFVVPTAAQFPQNWFTPWLVLALSAMMVMPVKIPKGLGIFLVTDTEVTNGCKKRKD
eukprot:gnl/TRDRNA2_/TRDRNA2_190875_c0_seq1.p1 gnl/TRDRNA2_/TRDRNA2_190875_c0~~gnl/TRDRNA2_/TRDRNA2_190875_c0_seq1.p1  ORF type:complete len:239 (-),score=38.08 gnl/TRDRNA2_/TRDRNA2_190875_c0_seq1:317-991(-)